MEKEWLAITSSLAGLAMILAMVIRDYLKDSGNGHLGKEAGGKSGDYIVNRISESVLGRISEPMRSIAHEAAQRAARAAEDHIVADLKEVSMHSVREVMEQLNQAERRHAQAISQLVSNGQTLALILEQQTEILKEIRHEVMRQR